MSTNLIKSKPRLSGEIQLHLYKAKRGRRRKSVLIKRGNFVNDIEFSLEEIASYKR